MRVLFFGSDSFGIPCLETIHQSETLSGIVTMPDRPGGRGMKLTATPVKKWAGKKGIKTYQPENLDIGFKGELKKLGEIDLILLISYGKKLPEYILKIPSIAPINVHPSLLPKYRGAAPMEWTLINGEKETGVTIITMCPRIDRGNILKQEIVPLRQDEDIFTLKERLSLLSAKTLDCVLKRIKIEGVKTTPQKGTSTYARKLVKSDGLINWEKTAEEIHNLVRGVKEWPGAYTFADGKILKIYGAIPSVSPHAPGAVPGKVVCSDDGKTINVFCGKGMLKILELQMEGRNKMCACEFLRGFRFREGFMFSDKKDL